MAERRGKAPRGDGRVRAIIDALSPAVDCGRFPAKRIAGEPVRIEAHCFADGHDKLRVTMRWQALVDSPPPANETSLSAQGNDVWSAEFTPPAPGRYRCEISAWVDHFESWRQEMERRADLDDVRVALQVGAALVLEAAARAHGEDAARLGEWALLLENRAREDESLESSDTASLKALALDPAQAALVGRYPDRRFAASASLDILVDRKRAGFSSWYELFPRSASPEPQRHGNFKDVEARLPYMAEMGFDVLYFPPIQPIGRLNRKGVNNALEAKPGDVGSPWAIGSAEGGHKQILPELGSLRDFRDLIARARALNLEIALDIAFQCAPDHPYVREHPDWFKHRPDGSVQYAENPPKKYQDIYPFDFETEDWRGLWEELKSIFDFWIEQGVRIFRVDNPHTKAFPFWEWLINEVRTSNPDVIFLAEAFTRPKVMHRLAKLGFTQSYTYFTWRNTKRELTEYFTELAQGPGRQYFRPNLWPNTPDILQENLQSGLRAVFAARLVLAATLSANYGIYGPTFELMESAPREPGSEEYLDSEKYQLRHWRLDRPDSLRSLIARINRIRRENAALQSDRSLRFCTVDNDQLIAYLKSDEASGNIVLTVVNLDPHHVQSGWVELDLGALGLALDQPYQVHDRLSEQRYQWQGGRNFVMLDPTRLPAHVFVLRRRLRSEHDFDYFI
ncbi:MAG TPA: alpha-1,4-glucan--maltose-1-phosphate maltosyltransferase [Steroidobacteraceae bacterium]|jgi:starch synthase (maltosyl-transferring)|nr:alpha-1,4-glucan--maltose-1-phosphate maltosyltransferase [Steroidobacteraceae bacterium]